MKSTSNKLLAVLFFGVIGAVISLTVLWAVLDTDSKAHPDKFTFLLQQAKFITGGGGVEDSGLAINSFEHGETVLAFDGLRLDAGKLTMLRYGYQAQGSHEPPLVYWRRLENPNKIDVAPIGEDRLGMLSLERYNGWQGTIIEFGIIFFGEKGDSFQFTNLALSGGGTYASLLDTFSDWIEFEPWSQRSINFLYGGSSSAKITLPLFVLFWIAVSFCLYLIYARYRWSTWHWHGVVYFLILGWLMLDARWLWNRLYQTQATIQTYAGKSSDQKLSTLAGSELFDFISRIKESVLPEEPVRLLLLHDSPANDFKRLRAQYQLAPHNVYNYGRYPNNPIQGKFQYIIVLGDVHKLAFDREKNYLRWGKNQRIPVKLVYKDPTGSVYRLRG